MNTGVLGTCPGGRWCSSSQSWSCAVYHSCGDTDLSASILSDTVGHAFRCCLCREREAMQWDRETVDGDSGSLSSCLHTLVTWTYALTTHAFTSVTTDKCRLLSRWATCSVDRRPQHASRHMLLDSTVMKTTREQWRPMAAHDAALTCTYPRDAAMESAMPSKGAGRGVLVNGFLAIGAESDDADAALASAMTVSSNVAKSGWLHAHTLLAYGGVQLSPQAKIC